MSEESAVSVDRFGLFPTPVFVYDFANLETVNADLRSKLVAESESSPGLERSDVGMWHSPPDLGERSDESFKVILGTIANAVSDMLCTLTRSSGQSTTKKFRYGFSSWAMVSPPAGYAIAHDHVSAHF